MRYVLLLATLGISCGAEPITEEAEPVRHPPIQVTLAPEPTQENPYRFLMTCEYGCPSVLPYVNVMPVFRIDIPDTSDTPDADADAGLMGPEVCGDTYEFTTCCGDDICQPDENSFFCPGDCFD